jgi:hypothetical protein
MGFIDDDDDVFYLRERTPIHQFITACRDPFHNKLIVIEIVILIHWTQSIDCSNACGPCNKSLL